MSAVCMCVCMCVCVCDFSRFVDDSHDVKSSDDACIFGGLSLGVVEVSRHCHHGVGDLVTQVGLGCFLERERGGQRGWGSAERVSTQKRVQTYLHLYKHHGGDLLWGKEVILSLDVDLHVRFVVLLLCRKRPELDVFLDHRIIPSTSNQPLGVKHSVLWVGGQLVLGRIPNQPLSVRRERHVGRSYTVALVIGNDIHTTVLVHANTAGKVAEVSVFN